MPQADFTIEDDRIIKQPFNEQSGQVLPLMIQPAQDANCLVDWVRDNIHQVEADIIKYSGILFRGFNIQVVDDFNRFMKCFNTDPLPYMFRSSPRQELDKSVKNIYLSTSYPNERSIVMHNESSYSRVWGRKIAFCCLTPAQKGGETPIADSRRVLKDIDPDLVEKFRRKGVRYRRNLLQDLGMPWQEVFQTDKKSEAEEICKQNKIDYRFIGEKQMIIEWSKPAVYKHPVSGEETWFNHAFFFNKYSRYSEIGLEPDDEFPEDFLTSNTFFGDGSEISYQEYANIEQAYKNNRIEFPYRKGDILLLDNMLAAHGRNPYEGDRVIATAIIEAAYDEK